MEKLATFETTSVDISRTGTGRTGSRVPCCGWHPAGGVEFVAEFFELVDVGAPMIRSAGPDAAPGST